MLKYLHLQERLLLLQDQKESEMRLVRIPRKKSKKKSSIIVRNIVRKNCLIIVLDAPLTFVQNVLSMVYFSSYEGTHKDHQVKLIKKAIS